MDENSKSDVEQETKRKTSIEKKGEYHDSKDFVFSKNHSRILQRDFDDVVNGN